MFLAQRYDLGLRIHMPPSGDRNLAVGIMKGRHCVPSSITAAKQFTRLSAYPRCLKYFCSATADRRTRMQRGVWNESVVSEARLCGSFAGPNLTLTAGVSTTKGSSARSSIMLMKALHALPLLLFSDGNAGFTINPNRKRVNTKG